MSDRRARILGCIAESISERGYAPSVREIAARIGGASMSSVQGHVDALVSDGVLERTSTHSRSLRIAGEPCPQCGGLGRIVGA